MLDMQNVFPSLGHIVKFMNLPTDVAKRMQLSRQRRKTGLGEREALKRRSTEGSLEERQQLEKETHQNGALVDSIPLAATDIQYTYPNDPDQSGPAVAKGTFQIPQGSFVTLVGHRGQGKTTLLKILGGVLLPSHGVFIPSHLRVLHISEQPLFFQGTLLQNLAFGVKPGDDDGKLERVVAICKLLQVPEHMIEHIHGDALLHWGEVLSLTQRVLLNLARALISNPEVLCIHKPTLAFDHITAENTLRQLRRFVSEKGLEQSPAELGLRRPRTCIITAGRAFGVGIADQILHVDSCEGVEEISPDDVKEAMLT